MQLVQSSPPSRSRCLLNEQLSWSNFNYAKCFRCRLSQTTHHLDGWWLSSLFACLNIHKQTKLTWGFSFPLPSLAEHEKSRLVSSGNDTRIKIISAKALSGWAECWMRSIGFGVLWISPNNDVDASNKNYAMQREVWNHHPVQFIKNSVFSSSEEIPLICDTRLHELFMNWISFYLRLLFAR